MGKLGESACASMGWRTLVRRCAVSTALVFSDVWVLQGKCKPEILNTCVCPYREALSRGMLVCADTLPYRGNTAAGGWLLALGKASARCQGQ